MGQTNRQRRALKQRHRMQEQQRARAHAGSEPADVDRETSAANTASELLHAVARRFHWPPNATEQFWLCAARHQQAAVDEQLSLAVDRVVKSGWTPLDLHEIAQRKVAGPAVAHLLDLVAAATARHPDRLVHPQWRSQLDQFDAVAPSSGRLSPAYAWGQRVGLDWRATITTLISVLVMLYSLPELKRVLPPPGEAAQPVSGADGIDTKVLRRVRGLLAKAESTEHPEEADALTSKAQELMARYSIERAVAESSQPVTNGPVARRMWLDSPYAEAKAVLVRVVADANNCRAIQSMDLGFVTTVGHSTDLDVVELLVTSLLLQATRAMSLTGSQVDRYGTSTTRSFRRSFLISYAHRIGERLRESVTTTETSYDTNHGGALVPVLAARRDAVEATLSDLFPNLVARRISISNGAGWGAGRAAADRAQLNVRRSVSPRAS